MKKLLPILSLGVCALALGEDQPDVSIVDFIMAVINAAGGLKGASILAGVGIVIQLLMLFFRTPLALFASKFKLVVVAGLSLVGGIVGLAASGMSIGEALLHSSTLAFAQVFFHQVYVQFIKKESA